MNRASLLLPLILAPILCASPALAQGGGPLEIVQQLYANHPHETDPPGGMEIWTPEMQFLWQGHNEIEAKLISGELEWMGEGLVSDFMINSQEDYFTDLKLKLVPAGPGSAAVRARMDIGGDDPIEVVYQFIETEIGWQISEVILEGGAQLSEEIKATR